jgi:hypothetical protein
LACLLLLLPLLLVLLLLLLLQVWCCLHWSAAGAPLLCITQVIAVCANSLS